MKKLLQEVLAYVKKSQEYFYYVVATVLNSGLHFIFSVYVKAYVKPLEYGIYSSCLLLQTYLTYLQLGSLNAFNRDYPQLIGAKKTEEAHRYRNTTFTFLLMAFGGALAVILPGLFFLHKTTDIDPRYIGGFAFSAIITGMTVFENFGASKTRIEGSFMYVSTVTLLELLSLILGLLLVRRIGYYGLYITSLSGMAIGIILYIKPAYSDIRLSIDRKLLKDILISGLPLLINGLIWTVVNSVDKFVILGFIGTEALGVYAIAQNAFSYMVLVPTAMSQLFYVKMGKAYGERQDVEVLTDVGLRFTGILAVLISFLAVIAYFMSPVLVRSLMPNYVNGISSAQILILGLAIYAPTLVNGNILTILKKNAAILRSSIFLCVLNAICSVLFVSIIGPKIECVALGTAAAYLGQTFILIFQLKKYANCKIFNLLKCSVFPVLFVLVISVVCYTFIGNKFGGMIVCLLLIGAFYAVIYRDRFYHLMKGGK